jgi:type III pantothenate kinase
MLRRVSIERPESLIGKNTVSAVQSGLFYGYSEMVTGMIRRFKAEVGDDATVIATGGYAALLLPELSVIDAVEPNLNLDGLRMVYEANR